MTILLYQIKSIPPKTSPHILHFLYEYCATMVRMLWYENIYWLIYKFLWESKLKNWCIYVNWMVFLFYYWMKGLKKNSIHYVWLVLFYFLSCHNHVRGWNSYDELICVVGYLMGNKFTWFKYNDILWIWFGHKSSYE